MKSKIAWWDKLGKPQYGGEMVIRASRNIENFDPYFSEALTSIYGGWMERLVSDDWTLDPAVWDYKMAWHPSQYHERPTGGKLGVYESKHPCYPSA